MTKFSLPCDQQSPQKLHGRDVLCIPTKVYGMHCCPSVYVFEIIPVKEEKIEMTIRNKKKTIKNPNLFIFPLRSLKVTNNLAKDLSEKVYLYLLCDLY